MATPACSFRHLLRPSVSGSGSKKYMAVAVLTARHLLRARKPFEASAVNVRRAGGDRVAQRYVGEFLAAWQNPRQASRGAEAMLEACPRLGAKARKLYKGY